MSVSGIQIMMTVLNCVATEHNLWLVLLAALTCVSGSVVTLGLFQRVPATRGGQRFGWLFLTAVAAGASIWSTHFVAMLGYEPPAPVAFDPVLTVVSLLIAIVGTLTGFGLAALPNRVMPVVGGATVGLAVSAMHYTGMFAYRVDGVVDWDQGFVVASILLATGLGAAALHVLFNEKRAARYQASGLLVLAIVSLHFTAMAAFRVTPMAETFGTDAAAMQGLALSIALVALIIVGAGLSSYVIDSRQRSDSYEQLRHMALFDTLTGLPNRASFNAHLEQEIERAARAGLKVAVIGLDLDRFKEINDTRGHAAGDEALRQIAQRMRSILADGEYAARLGGDEFAAVKRFGETQELLDFVARLDRQFDLPIVFGDGEVVCGASLGVAAYPQDADGAEGLISNADLAMYHAKNGAAERVCFYDVEMGNSVRSMRSLAEDLRHAIEQGALAVHYQVQASLHDGEVRGYEALVRWNHPERGNIPPSEFIPLAEENGLILPLGEWVLRRACRDAAAWDSSYRVAVNLSAVQLGDLNLPRMIHEILLETGLPAARLELELTETALAKDKERSLHLLRQIKAMGVSIALDDFGTGYSSLETLRTFPFDKIKLDRAFVSDLENDVQSMAVVRAVLALGKSLGIPVLAEGIENPQQQSVLQQEGCDEAQGFLLGRPASMADLGTGDNAAPYAASARLSSVWPAAAPASRPRAA